MHSPKKKYRVKLNDGTGRIIHYGGLELADLQDLLGGKPVINPFWEISDAAKIKDQEEVTRRAFQILGDKEILALLHIGIRGGGGDPEQFTRERVGNLMLTTMEGKGAYIEAIVGTLGMIFSGKDQEALAEEAAEKKAAEKKAVEDDTEGEETQPNPT